MRHYVPIIPTQIVRAKPVLQFYKARWRDMLVDGCTRIHEFLIRDRKHCVSANTGMVFHKLLHSYKDQLSKGNLQTHPGLSSIT